MGAFRSRQPIGSVRYDLLPPEPKPVSRVPRRLAASGDITDAEFVVVRDVQPSVEPLRRHPARQNDNRKPAAAAGGSLVLPIVARLLLQLVQVGEGLLRRLPVKNFAVVVCAVFLLVFAATGGFQNVIAAILAPAAKPPVLDLTHVSLTPQDANGMRLLRINGIVENNAGRSMAVPVIRADLMSGDRLIASALIAPAPLDLAAGHSRGFSARLPHPGGKMPALRLSFAGPDVSPPRL